MEALELLIQSLAEQHPILFSVFAIIGVLRTINKPLFAFLRAYVASTPTKTDDLVLDKIESSTAYKIFAFSVDWLGSIKLKEKK